MTAYWKSFPAAVFLATLTLPPSLAASDVQGESLATNVPAYDEALAKRLGADALGMRRYVLVILKSGPTPVSDPEARSALFAGHFANMARLAAEGKLVVAGPFMQNEHGMRGLFLFAVDSVEEAKALAETDPVIVQGEMVAEYHPWYGSAALMEVPSIAKRLIMPKPESASAAGTETK